MNKKRPVVIAHRGASYNLPEESLEAAKLAIEMGADFIEFDIVLTKDGVPILCHNAVLDEFTDAASKFSEDRKRTVFLDGADLTGFFASDFTFAEISTLRLHTAEHFKTRPRTHDGQFRIARFEDVVRMVVLESRVRRKTISIYPEIKHASYHGKIFGPNVFQEKVLRILQRYYGRLENLATAPVILQSFEVSDLIYLRRRSSVRTLMLFDYDDVAADGSVLNNAQYRSPPDFYLSGDPRTFNDLLTGM